jgi:hypothetical protein
MSNKVSLVRLYVLRGMYLLNCVLVGSGVCYEFIHRQQPWDSTTGVAFSFWAALSVLSALGIRYPLAMLPLLFIQLFYKMFWLVGVYPSLRAASPATDAIGFLLAVVLDIVVIPWSYVFAHFLRKPGDTWGRDPGAVKP